ncbi:MAG: hypothetical protein ACLR1P_08320 [Oscillospiraceae bacterium]
MQANTYTPEHLREVYEENKAALLAAAAEESKGAECFGAWCC